ncbi:MAG: Wzz/FepE/Etk N-terminal domain-containing protein [Ginsengibacter sp.]
MSLEENRIVSDPHEGKPHINESLNRMIKALLKIWWLFLIVGIVAGIMGIIYASEQKINYKSRLTFALDDGSGEGMGNFLSLASQFGLNIGSGKDIFAGDNILEIMKSRRMLERVLLSIDTFDNKPFTLIEYFLDKSGKRKSIPKIKDIHFPVGQVKSDFSYEQDSVLYNTYVEFADKYVIAQRPDHRLSIYEVNITNPDEKFTKDFTDRIVTETNNFYIEIRTKKAKETLDILEERVATMKGNLNSSIANKASVQDVNINPAFSAAQVPIMKQQENIQVYGGAYGEMFKNLELARFQYLNEIPLMQIIDHADYPMQKIKISKLKTAIVFSVISGLLLLFIFWLIRIIKLSSLKPSK